MPKSPDDDLKLPGLLKVHQVNFRKATGLTQAELARAVGLNGNTLSQIMNGKLPLTAEKKKLLTKELLLEEDDSDEFDEAWEHDERIKWAKGHGERAVPHVRPSMAEEESSTTTKPPTVAADEYENQRANQAIEQAPARPQESQAVTIAPDGQRNEGSAHTPPPPQSRRWQRSQIQWAAIAAALVVLLVLIVVPTFRDRVLPLAASTPTSAPTVMPIIVTWHVERTSPCHWVVWLEAEHLRPGAHMQVNDTSYTAVDCATGVLQNDWRWPGFVNAGTADSSGHWEASYRQGNYGTFHFEVRDDAGHLVKLLITYDK